LGWLDVDGKFGPVIPIVVSIIAGIGWIIFILLHAFFWSEGFTLFQNIVIGIVSLLIVVAVLGVAWVVWALRAA
jgi:hypothetical protein